MIVQTVSVTPLATNCYLVGCERTRHGAVIDPGGDAPAILAAIQATRLEVKVIINTHGHIDHTGANGEIKAATGARLVIHELDAPMLSDPRLNLGWFMGQDVAGPAADETLRDGDVLTVGDLRLQILHVPGHTPGGIALLAMGQEITFSGDALFQGSIGRSDFPGGDHQQLIRSISDQLLTLPDQMRVYPGHGPTTTIGEEKRHNPWLRTDAVQRYGRR